MPPKSTKTKTKSKSPTKSVNKKVNKKQIQKEVETNDDSEIINFDNLEFSSKTNENDYDIRSDYRSILTNYNVSNNVSSNKLTIYEATLLIGKRTTQLSYNVEPLVDYDENDTIEDIVIKELKERKTPFMIKRKIGATYEYWKLEDMVIDEELFSVF